MKESFYQWVKTLAVFYILFSAVLHLIPDSKYERYIRSFMGLLLIYILCTPVFAVFGRGSELAEIFSDRYTQEMQTLETEETENLQDFYLREGYCREIETEIAALCKKSGIKLTDTVVHIEGETVSAVLYIEEKMTVEQERGLKDALGRNFGIEEKNCQIMDSGNEQAEMGSRIAGGTSSDGDLTSGIKGTQ